MGTPKKKHIRTSKKGKQFFAGKGSVKGTNRKAVSWTANKNKQEIEEEFYREFETQDYNSLIDLLDSYTTLEQKKEFIISWGEKLPKSKKAIRDEFLREINTMDRYDLLDFAVQFTTIEEKKDFIKQWKSDL